MSGRENVFLKKYRKMIFCALFIPAMALFGLLLTSTGILDLFERKLVDFRFTYLNRNLEASDSAVFVTVDEDSLEHLSPDIGGWPWGRSTVMSGLVLEYIEAGDPAMILFDILYTEYSPKAPGARISDEDLGLIETALIYPDISFAANLNGVAVGEETAPAQSNTELPDILDASFRIEVDMSKADVRFPSAPDLSLPFPELAENASMIHLVNSEPDSDGTTRRYYPAYEYEGGHYPSLALKAVASVLGAERYSVVGHDLVLTLAGGGSRRIPLESDGSMRLNFYRDFDASFETYPAEAVIASAQNVGDGLPPLVPAEDFRNRVVVIGASAIGLKDLKVTPLGREIPGPYIHLTAISNMLMEQYLFPLPVAATNLAILVLVVLIVVSTLYLRNGVLKNLAGFTLVVLLFIGSLFAFRYAGIVVDMTDTLLTGLLTYFGALIFLSLTEGAEKNKISAAMGKYLAPSVMEEVLENYDRLVGEVGRRKDITVLFSDIRGFTTLSEDCEAEEVVSILNTYLASMIEVVFQYDGTLDKIIGDAIMAFWGAPKEEPIKERLAVRTALAMIRRLDGVNAEFTARGRPALRIGVGINTGDMIVGNIGSEKRLDYTLIGDNVNLGSRLEGLTKHFRVPIIISGSTWEKVKDDFVCVCIGKVAVKGKHLGIPVYCPMEERLPENRASCLEAEAEKAAFDEAFGLYLSGEFTRARALFAGMNGSVRLSGICAEMSERCGSLAAVPPGTAWDGIWRMSDK